ncbi:MAG: hypothetical protein WDZ47_01225 [Bacteroidales bacterium]
MNDFEVFDPGVTPDIIPGRISQLKNANKILTVLTIAALFAAYYYASKCHVNDDDFKKLA